MTIAQQFVRTRLPEGSVRLDSPFARRQAVGDCFRWSIMFDRITPPDVVVSPGEIIVLVDEATGTPELSLRRDAQRKTIAKPPERVPRLMNSVAVPLWIFMRQMPEGL